MAEQYYDISNPVRRELHRAYIRKCLDNFKDNTSVIQLIGAEFTGPLHFVQFWIDTIKEWEKETGKHPVIGLSTTKDVQDAILADKDRAGIVDLIDIRYWHYQTDGTAYAPQGGQNLAPRQHARLGTRFRFGDVRCRVLHLLWSRETSCGPRAQPPYARIARQTGE